jgi:hypothetical protein
MNLDLAQARADTPGVNHVAHLNNAGASLAPKPVRDALVGHLRLESEIGPYEAAERAQEALASVPLRAGDRVLISPMEYGSCYLSLLHLAKRHGVRLEVLPVDADGLVSVEELRGRPDERVKLIAMTHVPTHDSLVYPVALIGQVARQNEIPVLGRRPPVRHLGDELRGPHRTRCRHRLRASLGSGAHLAADPATGRGPACGDYPHPRSDGAGPRSGTMRHRRHHRARLGRGVGQGGAAAGRYQHVGTPG